MTNGKEFHLASYSFTFLYIFSNVKDMKITFFKDSTPNEENIISSNQDVLSRRRFTMLSDSEERLINEDVDNDEIIEG